MKLLVSVGDTEKDLAVEHAGGGVAVALLWEGGEVGDGVR